MNKLITRAIFSIHHHRKNGFLIPFTCGKTISSLRSFHINQKNNNQSGQANNENIQNHIQAYQQGLLLLRQNQIPKAKELFELSARDNNVDALFMLGNMYLLGLGEEFAQDLDKSLEYFEKLHELNYLEAECYLGYIYESKGELEKAFDWYLKSSKKGVRDALFNVGLAFYNGRGTSQNFENAIENFTKAGEIGHAKAQQQLGFMYYYGTGCEQDYVKSYEWHSKAAQNGVPESQSTVAFMLLHGQGVEKDPKQAFDWFTKNGDAESQFQLGLMYHYGNGIETNTEKSLEHLNNASNQGHPLAQEFLGEMYLFGLGVEKDYKKSLELFLNAAHSGQSPQSIFNIGFIYQEGMGVERNLDKSLEWYSQVSENPVAQYNVGAIYAEREDLDKAYEWYLKSAENDYVDAQYNVGCLCAQGKGTPRNDRKALEWITKAAEAGHENANRILNQINKK
ncbi:predicted protein [Naegleria gruberi]|uniref:Predicted protein n=1 Tax=Naegleria gruberi TaxID=5762 RepID=D2VGT0_NAEGR|nr:uncharacterized protein NAEGRDRAFT_49412 [Naegleria gruberi]EFC44114.1 predicted protein [Naegleria gruberi]|eukprot:XP_002676858.1 predicted protein [Naegleria gruberi strain NEG-M]